MKIKLPEKLRPGLRPLPAGLRLSHPHIALATWLGAGRMKPGSGTWGTVAALPFGYALYYFTGTIGLAVAALLLLIIGTISADFYGKKSGTVDDQAIVVDEVVGVWIAALPAEGDLRLWLWAFVLFRLFDIYKPWPASYFDNKSRNGFDVMMDDVVAGFYAMVGIAAAAMPELLKQ